MQAKRSKEATDCIAKRKEIRQYKQILCAITELHNTTTTRAAVQLQQNSAATAGQINSIKCGEFQPTAQILCCGDISVEHVHCWLKKVVVVIVVVNDCTHIKKQLPVCNSYIFQMAVLAINRRSHLCCIDACVLVTFVVVIVIVAVVTV